MSLSNSIALFRASGGVDLAYRTVPAGTEPPRTAIILLHGFGDHSGALPYRNITGYLHARGHALYTYDHRGHGTSPGVRGSINGWSEYRDDLAAFVRLVQVQEAGHKLFLVGLSMGALMALDYLLHQPEGISGVIAVAAPVGKVGASPVAQAIGKLLSRVAPGVKILPKLDLNNVSRDLEAVQEYIADPACHQDGTARFIAEFLSTVEWVRTHASEFKTPLLMLHGSADKIAAPDSFFFDNAASPDKKRQVYEGAYHNLFIETNRDVVYADIAGWLEAHS